MEAPPLVPNAPVAPKSRPDPVLFALDRIRELFAAVHESFLYNGGVDNIAENGSAHDFLVNRMGVRILSTIENVSGQFERFLTEHSQNELIAFGEGELLRKKARHECFVGLFNTIDRAQKRSARNNKRLADLRASARDDAAQGALHTAVAMVYGSSFLLACEACHLLDSSSEFGRDGMKLVRERAEILDEYVRDFVKQLQGDGHPVRAILQPFLKLFYGEITEAIDFRIRLSLGTHGSLIKSMEAECETAVNLILVDLPEAQKRANERRWQHRNLLKRARNVNILGLVSFFCFHVLIPLTLVQAWRFRRRASRLGSAGLRGEVKLAFWSSLAICAILVIFFCSALVQECWARYRRGGVFTQASQSPHIIASRPSTQTASLAPPLVAPVKTSADKELERLLHVVASNAWSKASIWGYKSDWGMARSVYREELQNPKNLSEGDRKALEKLQSDRPEEWNVAIRRLEETEFLQQHTVSSPALTPGTEIGSTNGNAAPPVGSRVTAGETFFWQTQGRPKAKQSVWQQ